MPTISLDRILQRFVDRRRPQKAEQLVEVPTVFSLDCVQQLVELMVDIPGSGRRWGGGGGLQGFLPEQNKSASAVKQIIDIPVRSGGPQGFRPGQVQQLDPHYLVPRMRLAFQGQRRTSTRHSSNRAVAVLTTRRETCHRSS